MEKPETPVPETADRTPARGPAADGGSPTPPETSLVLITGMSGAGRKAAATALEEMGWYVADNLPPELIMRMVELSFETDSPVERLAIVTDVRSRDFAGSLEDVLTSLHDTGRSPVVLFMEADDATLIRRFDTVRRTHPLQDGETLQTGIDRERAMLAGIRARADVVIDTSGKSIHDLRRSIEDYFRTRSGARQHLTIESFGFKHGAPRDVDMLLDVRFLPNPYWDPDLRPYRGVDEPVSTFVLSRPGAREFIGSVHDMVHTMLPGYRREGKNFIALAVGCTGGHHRSVAVVEELAELFRKDNLDVRVVHRDLERNQ
ncbi:RNase adapter RapZ [Corynebacterium bovis]|uniref:RNase adapter RapZ n=1 Tax=Corynebacterium bovis TaxID=36808 RepID=UPI00244D6677|nr:RNase adapter RapZ [Corynebacterium bovis]MDH2455003.1 RNase adapter RapZ [Corynebacterium bovis]